MDVLLFVTFCSFDQILVIEVLFIFESNTRSFVIQRSHVVIKLEPIRDEHCYSVDHPLPGQREVVQCIRIKGKLSERNRLQILNNSALLYWFVVGRNNIKVTSKCFFSGIENQ